MRINLMLLSKITWIFTLHLLHIQAMISKLKEVSLYYKMTNKKCSTWLTVGFVRPCVLRTAGMNSVLTYADTRSRSYAERPAEPREQRLLENNPIDLFCLEYKSWDAVCGCERLLESAHTTAMNMDQRGCRTDSGPADPGAKEAVTSAALRWASSRSPHLINLSVSCDWESAVKLQ